MLSAVWMKTCLVCLSDLDIGIYPPQIKVFELRQLSLKFERHLVSEIINFQVTYYLVSLTFFFFGLAICFLYILGKSMPNFKPICCMQI